MLLWKEKGSAFSSQSFACYDQVSFVHSSTEIIVRFFYGTAPLSVPPATINL